MEHEDDSQDEPVQTVRPVHKNNLFPTIHAPVAHVVINIEPNGKKIVLWDDILQAFKDASHARHGTKILPFLKGPDYKYLDPLRFNAVPNAILDIVVDGQFTSTDPVPVQSTFKDIADHSSQYPKYNPIDRLSPPMSLDTSGYPSPSNHPYFIPDRSMPTPAFWNEGRVPPPQPPRVLFQQTRLPSQQSRPPLQRTQPPASLPSRAPPPHASSSSSSSRLVSAPVSVAPKPRAKVDVKEVFRKIGVHINLVALEKKGDGTPVEFLKALLCYLKAVHKGHGYATFSVGELFAQGKEVDQDDYRAFVWYLKAAYLGNDVAQRKVSRLIYNQPSRSTAAPEAVLGDAVKTAQVEPAAIVSLVETRIKRQATVKEIFSEVPLEKPTEVLDTPASVASETVWEESSNSSDDDVFVDLEPIDSSEDGSSDKDDNASHGNPNNNFTYGINSYSSHSGYACDHCHNASSTTTINIARAPQTLRGSDTATFTSAQHSSIKVGRRAPQMDTNDITLTLTNAGHGDTEAQVRMGDMFLQMNDPSHDEQAVQWFFKAAIRGDSRGQHRIADMFMKGRGGVPVDYSAAMHWYLEAAEQGDVGAQRQAAMLYTKNLKHSMDDSMAVKWFLKHRHYRYAHVGSNRYRENI